MPHLLIAGKIHQAGLALIRAAPGWTFDLVEEVSEFSCAALIDRAEALVLRTQPLTEPTIARAAKLRVVSRHGVGYDAVDGAALARRGIPLTVVGDVNSGAVAEQAVTLILAALKRLREADRAMRDPARWAWRNGMVPGEARGRTLLLVGYGRIGQRVAALATALGMTVLAHDPWLFSQGWPEGPASPAPDLHQALARADLVSLHTPGSGKPLLGEAEFAAAKPGLIVINTARGSLIDEAALARALASGQVAAAGLDVLAEEPPEADHPLFAFDQVIFTPHVSGLTTEGAARLATHSVQNVLDYFAGTLDPALVVNGVTL